jgi:UPF0271 protein
MIADVAATIDLNVDAGESYGPWVMGDDAAMFERVTTVNVAAGFHAGDPGTIRRTIELAKAHGVAVGAHPGLPDRVGFGRRGMTMTPQDAHDDVLYQIGAVAAFCRAAGVPLVHAKMHGALSTHVAERSPEVADAIVAAVRDFDPALPIVVLPASELARAAARLAVPVVREGFPERGYAADGTLLQRGLPGAIIHDPKVAAERAAAMARAGEYATLCIHGDNPHAVEIATAIRSALDQAGIGVAPV